MPLSHGMPSISSGPCIPTTCAAPSIGFDHLTLLSMNCSTCGLNLPSANSKSSTVPVLSIVNPGNLSPLLYISVPQVLQK
ncbi:hypothetical protein VTO58DRAFT_108450 [Aureobasidium pullulans]